MTRILRRLRLAAPIGVVVVVLTAASLALASEPDKGTIGKSAPKVEWKGTLSNSGIFYNAWAQDPSTACAAPACDPFALTVADGGVNVTVKLNVQSENTTGGDPGCGLRITFPDGTYQYTQGSCGVKTTLAVKLKNVKAGDYEINSVSSHVCCASEDYLASAEIPEAAAAPAPSAPPPPSAPPAPAPAQPPAAPQLTVKPGKASAKKIAKTRRYGVSASTTAPLKNVVAKLLKGKQAVASAKLATLSGTANLVLKLAKKAKVKQGAYTVTVSGVDEQGRTVTTGVKIKVGK